MKHGFLAAIVLIAAALAVDPARARHGTEVASEPEVTSSAEQQRMEEPDLVAAEAEAGESGIVPPPSAPGRLTIRGRVRDASGAPILAVQMFLEGSRREVSLVDHVGRFRIDVPIGPHDRLIRSPLALWLNARRTGHRIALASGAPRLRMEVRAYDDSLGARHLHVRTNDAGATDALVRAFADGRFADTLDLAFVGEPGKDPEPRDVAMDQEGDVIVRPGRVTSYGMPDSSAGITAPARSNRDTLRAAVPPPSRVTAPSTERTPAARTARETPPDTCTCRIEGVIEVQWDHPLPERAPVALWVEGKPAQRDSVELLLGSPRAFTLQAIGCGTHRIGYEVYSKLKFRRRTPEPVIECAGGMHQLRIVLEPMNPRIRR